MNTSFAIKKRFRPLSVGKMISGIILFLILTTIVIPDSRGQLRKPWVHDPVMIKQDSTYYVFCTGRGIAVWSSTDMEHWNHEDSVFKEAPEWTHSVVPEFKNNEWAPDISYHDGRYYLYYSVSAFGKNTSAIGVATNRTLHPDSPDFKWVDHGAVIQSVPGRDMWNAIDPNLAFDDAGTPWLVFGSYWLGIKLVKLRDNLLEIATEPQEWHTIAARQRFWKLDERDAGGSMNGDIEAPFIFRKNGYFYLFASWDRCCSGKNSTYKVVVGRSNTIIGPYLDRADENMVYGGGTLVARGNSDWAAVGHQAVYTIDGIDYLVMHGYDNSDRGHSKLIIKKITWDEQGWPSISL